ncbi:MAG: tRNA lysidine(34) synthetase TilS [Bacteroidales bacterium]|nr:tRNA lysidine(34) synthetase TilS [Bacteroidales bacterium]
MLEKFLSYNTENNLLVKNHKILAAISGGIDSMVMLNLICKADYIPDIVHCNFKLRNAESDEDEKFVVNEAKKLNLKIHTKSFDTAEFSRKKNISIQMAARELRYTWFLKLAEMYSYSSIAIAHNRDDLVETFLINLTRGTGIKGLTGIKARQDIIIRPILFASRNEIENYAKKENIKFREDSSNEDIKYRRNLIRHKIIPQFEKLNPSFRETLIRESEIFNATYKIYKNELLKIYRAITIQETPNHIISIPKILSLRLTPETLFDLLEKYGFSYTVIVNMFNSLPGESGKLFYSDNYILLKDRKTLVIEKLNTNHANDSIEIQRGIHKINQPIHLSFTEQVKDTDFRIPVTKTHIAVDMDLLTFPLKLRKWEKGDYFYPLGMKHKKKVSDYFTDKKINRLDKEKTWILVSENNIVWLVGHQIDDRFKITSGTTNILLINLNE